jgi:hypothetical protein
MISRSIVATISGAAVVAVLAISGAAARDQGLAPPPPPAPVPAIPHGLSSIGVTVVSAETGRPIKGASAILILQSPELTLARTVVTDVRGRALFLGLAKGRARLSASHPSFVSTINGQTGPGDTNGTFIPLDDNQRIDNVTIRLSRGGAIGGAITDEAGEPLAGILVRAYRRGFTAGRQVFSAYGNPSETDERGMYRIWALPAGDYVIGIASRFVEEDLPDDPSELFMTAPGTPTEAPIPALPLGFIRPVTANRIVSAIPGSPPPIDTESGASLAFPTTFFPGTTVAAAASPIRLAAGEKRDGVSFQLRPVPVTRVAGRVVDPSGRAPARVNLLMLPAGGDDRIVIGDFVVAGMSPNGEFGFSFVPAGQYVIEARGNGTPDPGQPPLSKPLWASVAVSVGATGPNDLVIKLEEGMAFGGQLRVDGEKPPALRSLANVRVALDLQSPNSTLPAIALTAGVTEEGRFHLPQLMPGEYRISVVGLPRDWRLSSAIIDGRDALDFGLKIPPRRDLDNAVLTISNRLAELSGTLRDAGGAPAARGTVIIFPSDAIYWPTATWRIQGVRPDADGSFRFAQLPAGSYLVVAADVEPGQWRDPAFLETLKTKAIPVVLRDGEKATKDLRW